MFKIRQLLSYLVMFDELRPQSPKRNITQLLDEIEHDIMNYQNRGLKLLSKECKITANEKVLRCSFIPLYECGKLIMYSDERRSIAQQTSETKFIRSKISYTLPVR